VEWLKPGKFWIFIMPLKDNCYVKQLKAFYRSIVEDTEPPITGEDRTKSGGSTGTESP